MKTLKPAAEVAYSQRSDASTNGNDCCPSTAYQVNREFHGSEHNGRVCTLLYAHRSVQHRHRIDKYLDTRCPIATVADRVTSDHFQHLQSQNGRLPEILLAYYGPTNHSKAASLWLVRPNQVVGDHQWPVNCWNVEYLNFRMQNMRPSKLQLFSSDHLVIISIPVASGLFTSSAPVLCTYKHHGINN